MGQGWPAGVVLRTLSDMVPSAAWSRIILHVAG